MEGLILLFAISLLGMIVVGFIVALIANGRSIRLGEEIDRIRTELRRLKENQPAPPPLSERIEAAQARRQTVWMGGQPTTHDKPQAAEPPAAQTITPAAPTSPEQPVATPEASAAPAPATVDAKIPPTTESTESITDQAAAQPAMPPQEVIEQLPPQEQPAAATDSTRSEGPGLAWMHADREPESADQEAADQSQDPRPEHPSQSFEAEPEPSRSLEEMLGTRLFIWIGAIAVALAGIFFLKWSYDFVSPPVKVFSAMGFSALMIGAAQWLRGRYERLAQGLCGAAIAILYGATLAGVHLFEFIPKTAGLGMMVGITAAAVGLSLRHGPFIALLGLLGGFATPALIRTGENSADKLFGYLLLLQVGLLVLTRMKQWWWLMGLTLAGSLIWAVGWAGSSVYDSQYKIWASLFTLGTVVSFVVSLGGQGIGQNPFARIMMRISGLAGIGLMLLLGHRGGFEWMEWFMFGILGVGLIAVGRLRPQVQDLAWFAGIAGILMTGLAWGRSSYDISRDSWMVQGAMGMGMAYMLTYFICMWGTAKPGWWAGASAASAVLFTLAAYTSSGHLTLAPVFFDVGIHIVPALILAAAAAAGLGMVIHRARRSDTATPLLLMPAIVCLILLVNMGNHLWIHFQTFKSFLTWQEVFLGIALLLTLGAWSTLWKRDKVGDEPAAWLLTGVSAMASLAMAIRWMADNPTWLSMGLALQVPVVIFISHYLKVPKLERLAWALTMAATMRLALNPMVLNYDWSHGVHGFVGFIFNPITACYLPCILALAIGAWLVRRKGEQDVGFTPWIGLPLGQSIEAAATLIGFFYITFAVRHGFHMKTQSVMDYGTVFHERMTYAIIWSLAGAWGIAAGRRLASAPMVIGSLLILLLGLAYNVFVNGFIHNPSLSRQSIDGIYLFNELTLFYGLPLLAGIIVWCMDRKNPLSLRAYLIGGLTIASGFLLITMNAHHINQGGRFGSQEVDLKEIATYALVWGLAAAGLWWGHERLKDQIMKLGAGSLAMLSLAAAALTLTIFNPLFDQSTTRIVSTFTNYGGENHILRAPDPWLLYDYGLPMALYLAAAAWLTRRGHTKEADVAGHAGTLMLAALLTVSIHHLFGGGSLRSRIIELHEYATYGMAWAGAAAGFWWAHGRWSLKFTLISAKWLGALALIAVAATLTVANPAYSYQHVGSIPVLNLLLYDYGLPMALVLGAAAWLGRQGHAWPSRMLGYVGMVLMLALVTLLVRQGFRGDVLHPDPPSWSLTSNFKHAEQYAYSLAWVILAGLLLWAGVVKVWLAVRHAAMGIMSLAIIKVFIFDMSHLAGIWRILSLLGLGLSLIAVGFVYLKFVFQNPAKSWEDK